MFRPYLLLFICAISVGACTSGLETIGTISITQFSYDTLIPRQVTLNLSKGDVVEVWNDMSIESRQKNEVQIHYGLERYINGESKGGLKLDALKTNPTIPGTKQRARGRLSLSFQGKLTYINIEETGKYTFKSALFSSDQDLIIHRAKLIFKKQH